MRKDVYNLEFPSWCPGITLFGYRFSRVDNYQEQVCRLQHLGTVHSEFKVSANTGAHAITAYVEIPEQEESAILEWGNNNATALNDILLLLSIFTKRDVFVVDPQVTKDAGWMITSDPRVYYGGGILRCSIPYKAQPIDSEPYGYDMGFKYDIGFEEGLNRIYSLIRSEEWQRKYRRGYFLFLARMAFRRQPLEAVFIQCWTIWEHLFAILNQNWLSLRQIRQISAVEKVSYILVKYALRDEIGDADRKKIESLANIRNRLVHFGRFPDRGAVHDDAVLFTRLTEFIIARILGLAPSDVLNTMERLEEFLTTSSR
jgi:hypothetical protein